MPGLLVIALVVFIRLLGGLQFLERFALDAMLRLRLPESIDERILIVGIDEQDLRQAGYPISDRELSRLLQTLQRHQPSIMGLDLVRDLPVEPGHAALAHLFQTNQNIIGIEKVLSNPDDFTINPPPDLPEAQLGFVDALLDGDGYLRRSLLATSTAEGYKFSLTLRLAERYLADQGIALENGLADPEAMQFGQTELTRFQPNTGGYIREDAGGNQILINFRSGAKPFRVVSMREVLAGRVPDDWIRDRIVLIGLTALSAKDTINSAAVAGINPGLVYGIEIQAHAVSQIVSAVLDNRSLLQVWSEAGEYLWIVFWGLLGISLGRFILSPFKILLGLGLSSALLVGICYGLLLLSWWVPLIPTVLVLVLNGTGLTASLFYRHAQDLKARVNDRQLIIDQTFDAIHNGPLQTLAKLLRDTRDQTMDSHQLCSDLEHLNQELRAVYDTVRREALSEGSNFHLSSDLELDLRQPTHEVLYEVYVHTLAREFPGFKTLKLQVTTFEDIDSRFLTIEQKRGLCRFLEEALCNVGRHAIGVTRLDIVCKQEQNRNVIRVMDNGSGAIGFEEVGVQSRGRGTQQAKELARQLGGTFRRTSRKDSTPPHNSARGTLCELTWSVTKPWFWRF
jgi:CHASE2 domain-containing sensor protein/two-component sensor histidine kinase